MEFIKIEIRNFRPYYGDVTIEPRAERDKPLVLIRGKNDTGKTSLFSAIRFCLYGAESRGERDSVINRRAATESDGLCRVVITFEHEDQIFTIDRGIEFQQVSDPDDREASSWYREVTEPDGKVVGRSASEPEYRKFINRFIPENVASFFLFDAEKLEEFEDQHDESVRESIETILGIQEVENAIGDLADSSSRFNRKLSEVSSTASKVEQFQKELQEVMDEIDEIGDDGKGEIGEKQQKIRAKEASLDEVNQALQKAEGADELKAELEGVRAEIEDLRDELEDELIPERNRLRREIGPIAAMSAVDAFENQYHIEGAEGEASVINSILSRGKCLCGDDLTPEKREKLQERWNRLQGPEYQRLSKLQQLANKLAIDIEEKLNYYQRLQTSIRDNRSTIEALKEREEELDEQLNSIEQQYSEELNEKKQQLTNEIEKLEAEIRELREQKGELEGQKKRLQQRISSMDEATDEQRRYSALIDLADRCKDAFEDIKDELVDSRRNAVEEATSETFLRLTNRPDYYEGIRITRNYELRVLTETAERSIAEQRPSAGQRQIIAYSFIAGLSRFTTRNAPVVIDTPIGRLDPEHKNNLVNFYHEFSNQVMILYQPNELTEEDVEIMRDYISRHFEITIQNDDSSSTIQELPETVAAPTEK